jgi:hypothetical protein
MKKSFCWLLKTVSYLEISLLSTIAVIVTIDSVMASPLCYFVDAYGRRVDLSFVCQKIVPTQPPTQQTKPPAKPETDKAPEKTSPKEENSPSSKNSNTSQQGETKNSQSDSQERKIPLLNK